MPRVRVEAREFSGLGWVAASWGARAIVAAGRSVTERVREAIQRLSSPTQRRIHRHTGWRYIDGQLVYLHNGGAIGAENVAVELDAPLDRMVLPDKAEDPQEALLWYRRLLDVAPLPVTVPLVSAVFLAPVASILKPDFGLWLLGASGNLKSALAALAQQAFGATFDRKALPASWISTDNALESQLFMLQDAVCVVDDFAPSSDLRAQQELERRAARIVRSIGNGSGRGRLRQDLTKRPDRPPRGLVVSTGEVLPRGASILARLFVVEVERAQIDLQKLTAVQDHAGRLPHAMRGYIEWLRPQLEKLRGELPRLKAEQRAMFQTALDDGAHLRQPETLAHLLVGFDLFLKFSQQTLGMRDEDVEGWRRAAAGALVDSARKHAATQSGVDPAEVFVDVVRTAMATDKAYLGARDGAGPKGNVDGELVGLWQGDKAMLMPTAVHRLVTKYQRDSGQHWPYIINDVYKALVRRGHAELSNDGRTGTQLRVDGDRQRFIVVPLALVLDESAKPSPSKSPGTLPKMFDYRVTTLVPGDSSPAGDTAPAQLSDEKSDAQPEVSPLSSRPQE